MQSPVYETPVETQHDLVARVAVAAGTIRESFKEFSITWPGGAEHAMKSAAAILSNFYNEDNDNIPYNLCIFSETL
jgi:hypothetical protein